MSRATYATSHKELTVKTISKMFEAILTTDATRSWTTPHGGPSSSWSWTD